MAKGPIIRKSDWGKKSRKLGNIMEKFREEVAAKAISMFGPGGETKDIKWDEEPTPEQMRLARDRLVAYVREGMFARKDMEMEISALAAIVWFMRLEQDRRQRILDAW